MLPAFLLEFNWGKNLGVARGFPEFGGASGEEDGAVCFGEEDEDWPGGAGDDEADPEDPAPSKRRGDEAGEERSS